MKIKAHFKRFSRRYVQLLSAVLYNCNWKGFAEGRIWQGESKGLCVPGLNCYSCPGAVASCPLGSLQTALISSKYKFPYYLLGTILLLGLFLGRLICGFLCPFGLLQELLHKIPSPKLKKSGITRKLSLVKYGILVIFVILLPIAFSAPGFCKYICPAGTLEAGIPLTAMQKMLRSMIGGLFVWKVVLLFLIAGSCIFIYRAFCRFLCPLGAIYSFFQPVSFFGIRVDEEKCTHCGACVRACKMDVKKVCDRECIQCGECIAHCPENAIRFGIRCGKKQRWTGPVILGAAILLIAFGLAHGGWRDVLGKAVRICYECMGIG
ncbi:MAG: 4Fe-4S binding protein [Lachnospiraceae bacterium]|nr:4Fe-4S binding protein [Lachnospiraceae bacterium]